MSLRQQSSYFSLPLAFWQRPPSARIAKYEPKKRKRTQDTLHDDSDEDRLDDDNAGESDNNGEVDAGGDAVSQYSSQTSNAPPSSIVLTPDEVHQYRTSGMPMDMELPEGNFPHKSHLPRTTQRFSKKGTQTEMSQMSPPIFVPELVTRDNQRLQHLAVITTILHRCLMEGDYSRAGRAWGLILRDEFTGRTMDVRNENRWGIGAEILLWSGTGSHPAGDGVAVGETASGANSNASKYWFTRTGFEKARRYYAQLILQFPYRKSAPNALGPLDFYPAMFGLWIFIVQQEGKLERERALESFEDDYPIDFDASAAHEVMQRNQRGQVITATSIKELAEAQQIAAQMDELLVSPPFSDSYDLLRLRGMISLWIGDLHISSVSPEDTNEIDQPMGVDDSMVDSVLAQMEHGLGMERKLAEVDKANALFEKAKSRGRRASVSLSK